MEWDEETVQSLSKLFGKLLSRDQGTRNYGKSKLSEAADTDANYALSVLCVVSGPSFDEEIRRQAAINFTNHLQTRWVPSSATTLVIPDGDKEQITSRIVPLMLSTTSKIKAQLTKALAVIRTRDFPMLLLSSLPEVKSRLETAINVNDFTSVCTVLSIVNVMCKTCGDHCMSSSYLEFERCLSIFCALLLSTAETISREIKVAFAGFSTAFCLLIEAQRICFRILCVLNSLDVPVFPQKNADKWMNEINNYFSMRYKAIKVGDDDSISLVSELHAAVLENNEKGDKLFQKYLKEFVEDVRSLLVKASASPGCDQLTVTAIKFLTIVSTNVLHELFSGDNILQQITQSIVIPNVMLKDEDEQLFQSNYVEFMRRDMEGSNGHLDTRRRIACELLKGIAGNYKEKITQTVAAQIQKCFTLFVKNPDANWKYKDCAIYLVVSLATENEHAGGALISTGIVNVDSFFEKAIIPELKGQDVNAFPMLKAGALKFFTLLGVLIRRSIALALLSHVIRFLGSDMSVVRSYAARCIEKLLLVKNHGVQAGYRSMDIGPIVPGLMTNLFDALDRSETEDNQYIMRCIMHLFQIADISSEEVASNCISRLSTVLGRVCNDPKDPVFNHFLFEAVATLGPRACEKNPPLLATFEAFLEPNIRRIFLNTKETLYPYGFQLIAQVVDLRRDSILPLKKAWIYTPVFTKYMWGNSANIPALARLFQSYFRHVPILFDMEWRFNSVFRLIKELVSSSSTEEVGFLILNSTIQAFEYAILEKKLDDIWASLLQLSRTPRLGRCLILYMSLFLVKHGFRNLVGMIEKKISFHDLLGDLWILHLKTISGHTDVKLSAVASTQLICESQSLVDPSAAELWGKLLDGILTLLSQPQEERVEDEPEIPDFGEATGYSFQYAGKKVQEDPLKEIEDPTKFCVDILATLWSRYPGRFPTVIDTYVSSANQVFLVQLCNRYKIAIV